MNNKILALGCFAWLIITHSSVARVGDNMQQLVERYGKPVKSTEGPPPMKNEVFSTKEFVILCSFIPPEDKIVQEIILPRKEVPLETILKKYAADAPVDPASEGILSELQNKGVVIPTIQKMWVIQTKPESYAFYSPTGPSSDFGGGVYVFDSAKRVEDFFAMLAKGNKSAVAEKAPAASIKKIAAANCVYSKNQDALMVFLVALNKDDNAAIKQIASTGLVVQIKEDLDVEIIGTDKSTGLVKFRIIGDTNEYWMPSWGIK
ncbi:MAG: hypothetical protein WCH98_03990 [Verrucomicrobiota bacterium]